MATRVEGMNKKKTERNLYVLGSDGFGTERGRRDTRMEEQSSLVLSFDCILDTTMDVW